MLKAAGTPPKPPPPRAFTYVCALGKKGPLMNGWDGMETQTASVCVCVCIQKTVLRGQKPWGADWCAKKSLCARARARSLQATGLFVCVFARSHFRSSGVPPHTPCTLTQLMVAGGAAIRLTRQGVPPPPPPPSPRSRHRRNR